jgi:hypothetical protein
MSYITTAIPSGTHVYPGGPEWCIQGLVDQFATDSLRGAPPYTYNECANSTRGTSKQDFETFCCDGDIIDSTYAIWGAADISDYALDVMNLVCCRAGGTRQPGGIMPIDTDYKHCSASLVPTPLASLAATNSYNAALYTIVYESASQLPNGGWGDWTVTETPTCLWIQTVGMVTVPMTTVTVPAADITTLPSPTTNRFGDPILSDMPSTSRRTSSRSTREELCINNSVWDSNFSSSISSSTSHRCFSCRKDSSVAATHHSTSSYCYK